MLTIYVCKLVCHHVINRSLASCIVLTKMLACTWSSKVFNFGMLELHLFQF